MILGGGGGGCEGEGVFPTVSAWGITGGLCEEGTFEPSPEWRKEATYTDIRRRNIPGGEKGTCKGPEAGTNLVGFWSCEEARVAGTG